MLEEWCSEGKKRKQYEDTFSANGQSYTEVVDSVRVCTLRCFQRSNNRRLRKEALFILQEDLIVDEQFPPQWILFKKINK